MVALFDELDVDGTYHAVRWFFYERLPEIKRKAGAWGDYSSPSVDGMPKAPSAGNGSERRMINHSRYASALYAVRYAIKGCSLTSQKIIQLKYIDELPNWKIKNQIGYKGNGTYNKLVKQAALEFADCIEPACDYYSVEEKIIPDLHAKFGTKMGQNEAKEGQNWGHHGATL